MAPIIESVPFLADNDDRYFGSSNSSKPSPASFADSTVDIRFCTETPDSADGYLTSGNRSDHISSLGSSILSTRSFQQTSNRHAVHISDGTYNELGLSNTNDFGHFASNARLLSCEILAEEAK